VPSCGDGVVQFELGEECDDRSPCCSSSCRLASGARCSISSNSECCDASSCAILPASVSCGGGTGFCGAHGACEAGWCARPTDL
jgi:hypothetical protein